jgi:hypothetical protein
VTPRTLLTLAAGYLSLIGLGMLLVPQYFGIGAVPADASPALMAFLRIFGGPCLGIAVLNWLTRTAPPSPVQRAVLLANAVGFGLTAAADIWGVFHGARAIAKIFLVVHLVFAIAFALSVRGTKQPSARSA